MGALDGMKVGFIGLGLMGRPMARNLKRAGAELFIHNRSRGAVDELTAEGMTSASHPAEVAERAETIILMVTDTPAVDEVLSGASGALSTLEPGTLVIDMGTTAVTPTREFAARVRDAGGDYVDAPVSGGQVGAEAGSLAIMAGGSEAAFARARALFEVLGRDINRIGDVGAGQIAKAANQIIVGITIGAVAEALALAGRAGVDAGKVRHALMGGFAASRILELHGRRMIEGDFTPGGRARVQLKDLVQARDFAREIGMRLPGLELSRELYESMIAQGLGELDHSGLFKIIDSQDLP